MRKFELVAVAGLAALAAAPTLVGVTLWNNGDPNGINAYSNATAGVFGFRRTLMDDFFYAGSSYSPGISGLHWNSVWGTPMGGAMGTGANISFRSDVSGSPGMVVAVANLTGYSEVATGNIFFSREEVTSWATFDNILLPAGFYWFEATVQGPENNFWLTADQQLNECWVNYEDLGGFQSGTDQFGVASDLNFVVDGGGVPAPATLALLGLAGLAGSRRRRV